jgi:hypothetical protein
MARASSRPGHHAGRNQLPYWRIALSLMPSPVGDSPAAAHSDVVPGTRVSLLIPVVYPGSVGAACDTHALLAEDAPTLSTFRLAFVRLLKAPHWWSARVSECCRHQS